MTKTDAENAPSPEPGDRTTHSFISSKGTVLRFGFTFQLRRILQKWTTCCGKEHERGTMSTKVDHPLKRPSLFQIQGELSHGLLRHACTFALTW
jgi:hypothetical protein